MHNTKIGIFKIAQTRVNWPAVVEWLEFLGIKNVSAILEQIAAPSAAGQLDTMVKDWSLQKLEECPATDASALVALCGKRCYASFDTESKLNPNVTKIRTDHKEYTENILRSGHGSVLEHATWSFAIENVSRVFTGEMNRHRAGVAVSEASMRYIRFDDIGFTMPSSIGGFKFNEGLSNEETMKRLSSEKLFEDAFSQMQQWNLDLCNLWKIEEMTDFTQKKKLTSMFRRIIGMGVSTGGVWTLNARSARHILAMRGSVHAEEEIYDVFNRIAEIMIADEPLLFGDFKKDEAGSWVPKYPKV